MFTVKDDCKIVLNTERLVADGIDVKDYIDKWVTILTKKMALLEIKEKFITLKLQAKTYVKFSEYFDVIK